MIIIDHQFPHYYLELDC